LGNEEYIFLVRGRNTHIPLLRRCIDSVKQQTGSSGGIVLIDAASENGMTEYIENVLAQELEGRISILRNYKPLPAIENIVMATKIICSDPESVIIHLDADDALIGSNALEILRKAYSTGADATVGSMLRLDKKRSIQWILTIHVGIEGGMYGNMSAPSRNTYSTVLERKTSKSKENGFQLLKIGRLCCR
jgi:hypothetical protein